MHLWTNGNSFWKKLGTAVGKVQEKKKSSGKLENSGQYRMIGSQGVRQLWKSLLLSHDNYFHLKQESVHITREGKSNFSWKTLNCSIHPCLKQRNSKWDKHTDSSVMQISCHGDLSSVWSHTFLVFMQPCGEPQEEKTFRGRDYPCKIWGCSS